MNFGKTLLFFFPLIVAGTSCQGQQADRSLLQLCDSFTGGYRALNIPDWNFDYTENLGAIASPQGLAKQQSFFESCEKKLKSIPVPKLSEFNRLLHRHMAYEISLNLHRIGLERHWAIDKKIPDGGLYSLGKDWYLFYLKKWTSTGYTPEFLYDYGLSEIKRINTDIAALKTGSGAAYEKLIITDKNLLVQQFDSIKATVIKNMGAYFNPEILKPIEAMEWPGATYNTPPGIYLNERDNPYGVSVFQYSFFNKQHKEMNMAWLFLHEAIPGHHYQTCFRETIKNKHPFQELFFYGGNAEGWGAYVEYFGKELGVYTSPQARYGHLQWDLVRSARICIDIGIHYKGWSREKALGFWKEHIHGADDIAEREVDRCTRWPAQAISYKAGAYWIQQAKKKFNGDTKTFHSRFLEHSHCPLEIIALD